MIPDRKKFLFGSEVANTQKGSVLAMKLLSLENYAKAIQMVKAKGYDDKNTERIVVDIFGIVEEYGGTAEFYIEALPDQN